RVTRNARSTRPPTLDRRTETGQAAFGAVPNNTRAKIEPPFDDIPACLRRCIQCRAPSDRFGTVTEHVIAGERLWLHQQCADFRRRRSQRLERVADAIPDEEISP